jgi:hypothetical protein
MKAAVEGLEQAAVQQHGWNLVRDQGVGGSNPLSPTNYLNPIIELASFRFLQIPHLESTWV